MKLRVGCWPPSEEWLRFGLLQVGNGSLGVVSVGGSILRWVCVV